MSDKLRIMSAALVALTVSCGQDDLAVITASVDGEEHEFLGALGFRDGQDLLISGTTSNSIIMSIPGTEPGTFTCVTGTSTPSVLIIRDGDNHAAHPAGGSCTIVIDYVGSPGDTITGTFEAVLIETMPDGDPRVLQVTNGVIAAEYTD